MSLFPARVSDCRVAVGSPLSSIQDIGRQRGGGPEGTCGLGVTWTDSWQRWRCPAGVCAEIETWAGRWGPERLAQTVVGSHRDGGDHPGNLTGKDDKEALDRAPASHIF